MESSKVKSNGKFSIITPKWFLRNYGGRDIFMIEVLDHQTGCINRREVHTNTKGDYFKKKGNIYLSGFTKDYLYVPFQILYLGEVK